MLWSSHSLEYYTAMKGILTPVPTPLSTGCPVTWATHHRVGIIGPRGTGSGSVRALGRGGDEVGVCWGQSFSSGDNVLAAVRESQLDSGTETG